MITALRHNLLDDLTLIFGSTRSSSMTATLNLQTEQPDASLNAGLIQN